MYLNLNAHIILSHNLKDMRENKFTRNNEFREKEFTRGLQGAFGLN